MRNLCLSILNKGFILFVSIYAYLPNVDAADSNMSVNVAFGPQQGLRIESLKNKAELGLNVVSWFQFNTDVVRGEKTIGNLKVPLARFTLRASILDGRLSYFLMPELAKKQPVLLDNFIDIGVSSNLKLRLGQFRTPHSRAFMTPIVMLQLIDRGIVSDNFRLDRDTGLMAFGRLAANILEYYAGVFNGAATNTLDGDTDTAMGVLRLVLNIGDPIPYNQDPGIIGHAKTGLAIGLSGGYRRRMFDTSSDDPQKLESVHSSADITFKHGPMVLMTEGHLRNVKRRNGPKNKYEDWGVFVQGGIFLWPRFLEIAARASWLDQTETGWIHSYEAGLNIYAVQQEEYLGHHLKLSVRYGLDRSEFDFGSSADSNIRHRVTAQVQAWF